MHSSSGASGNVGSFQAFFEGWLVRQERLLNQLLAAQESTRQDESHDDNVARDLVARVLAHYQEYYAKKSRMANANVFLAFSPTWFTPLERTLLWIAGFKPRLVCRLAIGSLDDLTEDQIQRIQELGRETNRQEKSLNEDMAKIQESLASPPLVDLARRQEAGFQPDDGQTDEVDDPIESLKSAIVNVLTDADGLRIRTAEAMIGILSPVQNLKFFAAAAQLQFRIRTLGMQREAERKSNSIANGW